MYSMTFSGFNQRPRRTQVRKTKSSKDTGIPSSESGRPCTKEKKKQQGPSKKSKTPPLRYPQHQDKGRHCPGKKITARESANQEDDNETTTRAQQA